MTFDPDAFAAELRRALAGEPTDAAAVVPSPAPALIEPAALKCDAGLFRWTLTPTRDRDGYITAVDLRPIERITL